MDTVLFSSTEQKKASNALRYAALIAKKNKNKLSLLGTYLTEQQKSLTPTSRKRTLARLKRFIKASKLEKHPHRCYVRPGDVQNHLLKITRNENVKLVVLPRFSKEKTKKAVKLARKVMCPVLIVPEEISKSDTIQHIVYATKMGKGEESRIREAVSFAKSFDAKITFLHINTEVERDVTLAKHILLSRLTKSANYSKADFKLISTGSIKNGIQSFVNNNDTDLVMIETRHAHFFMDLFRRNLSEELAKETNIPMLVYKTEK